VNAQTYGTPGITVQVLGSGGPELQDKRASSSYLVGEDGQARALVDAGGGSALRFGESGATMSQLDVILFTHFHVDHSGDFPALIKSSWFEDRKRPLPIYGPPGNDFMPSTTQFVADFFGDNHGVFRYLSELLVPRGKRQLPHGAAQRGGHIDTHGGVPARSFGRIGSSRAPRRRTGIGLARGDSGQSHHV
jgi:glyoxylase-like metal-dependent hydrolase (beta-lactamase superfamily II)